MIDAVTLDDAQRVAKRLLDGGLLVTVVGRPEGLALDRRDRTDVSADTSAGCPARLSQS